MKSKFLLFSAAFVTLSLVAFKPFSEKTLPTGERVGAVDLVISALKAKVIAPNKIQFEYTVTNLGTRPAKLDRDGNRVGVQAMLSADLVIDANDVPAGGLSLANPPIPDLAAGASMSGFFISDVANLNPNATPFLILQVDQHNVLPEGSETNNVAVVGLGK